MTKAPRFRIRHHPANRAFTLIELVAVITVILILLALLVPSLKSLSGSAKLRQGIEMLQGEMALARQTAIKENRVVEVRFYFYDDPDMPGTDQHFRAVQYYTHDIDPESGEMTGTPASEISRLPSNIVIINSLTYSTLVADSDLKGAGSVDLGPEVGMATYYSFFFRPDGSADLADGANDFWFLTVAEETALLAKKGGLPPNYITLQLDPYTGAIRILEPQAG